MIQKADISCLSIRLGMFLLLISVSLSLSAQEDRTHMINESIHTSSRTSFKLLPPDPFMERATYPLYPSDAYPYKPMNHPPEISLKKEIYLPYYTNPSPIFRGDYQTDGIIKQFRHGAFFGSGTQTSLPGIGRFNNASLGYQHVLNPKLALQLSVNAMKINMSHISGQAFSTSGALLYHPSDQVTLKFFGSYDIGNSYGMSTHRYGATMSVDMSDRFSMEVGAQRYYNAMRGRWETVPIVIPYYRFEKFKLGLDVGGLIYEILREVVFDKQNSSGPTLAPPRFSIPIR